MLRPIPFRRHHNRRGFSRYIILILLLSFLISSQWLFSQPTKSQEIIAANLKIVAADGDSFAIGNRKLRLKAIDAPELHQTCMDSDGAIWACGLRARTALIALLAEPGLKCQSDLSDRFGRALAICSSNKTNDIGRALVMAGMAMSNEFKTMRTYGDEEDDARVAKNGIWRGDFIPPKEWRATHSRTKL